MSRSRPVITVSNGSDWVLDKRRNRCAISNYEVTIYLSIPIMHVVFDLVLLKCMLTFLVMFHIKYMLALFR